MRDFKRHSFYNLIFSCLIFLAPTQAFASLGDRGRPAGGSFVASQKLMPAYSLTEYSNKAGIIFAVTWRGRIHPDLSTILGTNMTKYRALEAKHPRTPGRKSKHSVNGSDLVVERFGHMRNLQGRAYLPSLLPPGVSLDEIR